MPAVFVNCAAVIIGSIIGLFFARKITPSITDGIQTAAGVITLVIGIQMALKYQNIVYLSLSLITGGLLGSLLDIDGKILALGNVLQRIFYRKSAAPLENPQNFAYAFLNASVLFCVGAMAIIGSFKAGIEHDYTIIFTKSILDGFMAVSFASVMGIGTAFSALAVLVYQGALTLLSFFLKPYVTEELINELTGLGGAMIIMIAVNLLELRKIKTANYLPAIIIEIVFIFAVPAVKSLFNF